MKNIFVYGITTVNVGDDLFMQILFERYPKTKMVLFASAVYKSLFKYYDNVIVVSKEDKTVHRIINVARVLHVPNSLLIYVYIFLKYKINLFLIIGGSLFMEGNSNMPSMMKKLRLIKLLFPKLKVSILGSNFGPYYTERFYNEVKNGLRYVDDVCFRDKASYDAFSNLNNVRWGNDIVLHMKTDNLVEKQKVICVNIRSVDKWPSLKPFKNKYLVQVKEQITKIQRLNSMSGSSVKLLSFCGEYGDNEIIDELYEMIEDKTNVERIYYDGDVLKILKSISECEYMIATRFHAIILGLVYNVKVLPISYSIKTENMLKSLGCWNDIYEFGAFCNSTQEELDNYYLSNIIIDETKNTQFNWLDSILC